MVNMLPCQFRRLRKHALQRRYNQCANEGGKDQQHNQRQAVSYPFHGVSVNLFFPWKTMKIIRKV